MEISNVVVSFLIKSVVDCFIPTALLQYRIVVYMLVAFIAGTLFAVVIKSQHAEKIMFRFFGTTAADTIWDAMNDPYCGSVVEIPLGDKIYQGFLVTFYPDKDDWWVVLEDYRVLVNGNVVDSPSPLPTQDGYSLCPRIAIKVSDCTHFVSYLSEEVSKRR